MRCAAEHARSRRAAALLAAGLAVACLLGGLTACTGGGAHHHLTPAQRFFARHPFLRRPLFLAGRGGVIAFFGGGGAGSRPKISVPPVPPATSSLPIPMPLEAYQAISTDQQEALAASSNLLAERCMAARGFTDLSPASAPYVSVAALEQIETAGTGLASLAQAQTFGFNRPKGTTSGAAGPAIIGIVGEPAFGQAVQLSPAYAEALYGFSPRGGAVGRRPCLQQASQAVYGPLNGEPVPDPVPRIAVQAVSFTRTDPRILAAGRAWAKCMARHFYRYTSPARAESRPWPSAPDKAEIATAVADVLCKTRVNYVNTWLTVEAAYQQALIRQNLAALAQLQANFAPLLRRAQAALTAPALTAPAAPPPRG